MSTMNVLLISVVLGLLGSVVSEQSRVVSEQSRVVSEQSRVCEAGSRPWQVRLHGAGALSCSGVLINKWWIITSFSCSPRSSSSIASLGEQDLNTEEGTEQHIHVADVIRHSPYRSPLHSLTMVRLAHPAQFNQYVQPIPVTGQCPRPGDSCSVSGWGSTVPNQHDSSGLLKCIHVPVVEDQVCMKTFPEYVYWSHGMVCAGSATTDNCLNDAGAVLVCDGQLQGVQWFGHGCSDPSHPSVYTKLCLYQDWIQNVIDQYTPTEPVRTTPSQR